LTFKLFPNMVLTDVSLFGGQPLAHPFAHRLNEKKDGTKDDYMYNICKKCKKKIQSIQYDMLELKYHGGCFRCYKCNERLSYITANRVGNEIYCDEHANRRLIFFWNQMGNVSQDQTYVDMTIITYRKKT
jgi:hypothetical protein